MEHKDEILDELKRLSSSLAKHPKPNKNEVPDAYFETFEASILDKVKSAKVEEDSKDKEERSEEKPKQFLAKELELKPNPKKINYRNWAIAASIAMVIGFGVKFISTPEEDTCDHLACLNQDDIEVYMEQNVDDFEDMILDEVDLDELYETSVEEDLYLDEIDESLLIDEL